LNSPRTGHGRRFARALIALAAVLAFEAHAETGGTFMVGACKLEMVGPGVVTGMVDARTLLLDGGREARLAGIEIGAAGAQNDPNEVLPSIVGRNAILRRIGPEQDRYGRLLVHLFVSDAGTERWIQADLLERGQARVAPRVGDRACARELLAREGRARDAKLGVWAEPVYGIMRADEPAAVARRRALPEHAADLPRAIGAAGVNSGWLRADAGAAHHGEVSGANGVQQFHRSRTCN